MERLPVAEPLRGSDARGNAAWNDGLGETDLQSSGAVRLNIFNNHVASWKRGQVHRKLGLSA